MKHKLHWKPILLTMLSALTVMMSVGTTQAVFPTCESEPCYSGGGISEGISDVAGGVGGVTVDDPRATIIDILRRVISFLGLIAVIVIVIAGLYLIFSNGNEEAKEKAKKIIIYVIAGMLLIIFASAIVAFIASIAND